MTHGNDRHRRLEAPGDELADGFAMVMDSLDRLTEPETRDLERQADCAVRGHDAYLEGLDLLERGEAEGARQRLHTAVHQQVPGAQDALNALDRETTADGAVSRPAALTGSRAAPPLLPLPRDVRKAVGLDIPDQRQFREQLKELRIAPGTRPLARFDEGFQTPDLAAKRFQAAALLVLERDELPAWDFVTHYLAACGLTETECLAWRQAWLELDSAPAHLTHAAPQPGPSPTVFGEPDRDAFPGEDLVLCQLGQAPAAARDRAGTKHASPRQATRKTKAAPAARPPVQQRPGRWTRGRHHQTVAAVCAALVVMAASWCLRPLYDRAGTEQIQALKRQRCETLNPALATRPGGECTGVTDGSDRSDVFGAELRQVVSVIAAENSKVQFRPHVTVAFLAPLSSKGTTGNLPLDQYVAEVEGAFTAVEQANATGSTVKIRLVLANMGSGERYWKDTVDQLKAERNLVAVTGMGSSRLESVQAARELSKAGIPMVAGSSSADGFDTTGAIDGKGRINGLARAGFTNHALLTAVGDELVGGTRTAALVRMSGTPDLYTESLYRDFRTLAGLKKHLAPAADFTFAPRGGPDVIGANLCSTGRPIDTVYFAAPETYLPDFLTALSRRSCHHQHITVVTGSGTAGLNPQQMSGLHQPGAPVTVLYPSLPGSDALSSPSYRNHELYQEFLQAFTGDHHGHTFNPDHATRGNGAVFAHDAVLTVATAIHNAAPATGLPNRQAVLNDLYALSGSAVPGATGRFGIDPTTGDRTPAPIVVHRLGATT